MKELITKEEINNLALKEKLKLSQEELIKYYEKHNKILESLEELINLDCDEEELIAIYHEDLKLFNDAEEEIFSREDLVKMAPKTSANMIEVPVMISE